MWSQLSLRRGGGEAVNGVRGVSTEREAHSQVLKLTVVLERELRGAHLTASPGGRLEDRPLWHGMGGQKESTGR